MSIGCCISRGEVDLDDLNQALAMMSRGGIRLTQITVDSETFEAARRYYRTSQDSMNHYSAETSYGWVKIVRQE